MRAVCIDFETANGMSQSMELKRKMSRTLRNSISFMGRLVLSLRIPMLKRTSKEAQNLLK